MALRLNQVGNKATTLAITVKNPSPTVTIPVGSPVFFIMSGTDDGLAVQNAADAGATANQQFFAGILTSKLAPGDFGEAVTYGIANARVLTTATAIVKGDIFTVVITAAADQLTRSGAGAVLTVSAPNVIAAAANATATGNAITLKVFVRAM